MNIHLEHPLPGSTKRTVHLDGIHIGQVEDYGPGWKWVAWGKGFHRVRFESRAQAVAWLVKKAKEKP